MDIGTLETMQQHLKGFGSHVSMAAREGQTWKKIVLSSNDTISDSDDAVWYIRRFTAPMPSLVTASALARELDALGYMPENIEYVLFISNFSEAQEKSYVFEHGELPGKRIDDIVENEPWDEWLTLDIPSDVMASIDTSDEFRTAVAALRIANNEGAGDLKDYEFGTSAEDVMETLNSLASQFEKISYGKIHFPAAEAIRAIRLFDKTDLVCHALIKTPPVPGSLEEEMIYAWQEGLRCESAWRGLLSKVFTFDTLFGSSCDIPEALISTMGRLDLLDEFLERAIAGQKVSDFIRQAFPEDKTSSKGSLPRGVWDSEMRSSLSNHPWHVEQQHPIDRDIAWGDVEQVLEGGWLSDDYLKVETLAANTSRGLCCPPRAFGDNVRRVCEELPADKWTILVRDNRSCSISNTQNLSLLSCLSLTGNIASGFGRCAVIRKQFFYENRNFLEEQERFGNIVLKHIDNSKPHPLRELQGIISTTFRSSYKLDDTSCISPDVLSGMAEAIRQEELRELLISDYTGIHPWSRQVASIMSEGKFKNLDYLMDEYDEMTVASLEVLKKLDVLHPQSARDAAEEIAGLQKIWKWKLGQASLKLPVVSSCWGLVGAVGETLDIGCFIDAFYDGVCAEDLIA